MSIKKIRLGSSSETRALLLTQADIPFIQSPVDFDDMPREEKSTIVLFLVDKVAP